MASFVPPKKNAAFRCYFSLVSQANAPSFQVNSTLAAGDVKVSTDGGALNNLTTLPSVVPAGSVLVQVDLSAAEMNGDNIVVVFKDVAGAEWNDLNIILQTVTNQNDDLAIPGDQMNLVNDAITAGKVAANAIGASEFDQTAADKVWLSVARTLTALGFQLGAGDFAAGAIDANAFNQTAADKVWASAARTLTALGFQLNTADFAGGFLTAALIAADAIDASKVAANTIGASEFDQTAADKVWASAARTLTGLGFQLNTADFVAGFLTAALIAGDAIDASKIAANAIGASEFDQTAADKVWTTVARTLTGLGFQLAAGDFAAGALDANALATSAGQEIADRILARSIAGGADGGRTIQDAFRILRNRRTVAGAALTVYQENDVAVAWTGAVATAPGNPVSDIDPA